MGFAMKLLMIGIVILMEVIVVRIRDCCILMMNVVLLVLATLPIVSLFQIFRKYQLEIQSYNYWSPFIATDVPGACLCKKEYNYQFEKCDPVIWKGFIRDNICHDKTNTKECNFDGGDCCRPSSYKVTYLFSNDLRKKDSWPFSFRSEN